MDKNALFETEKILKKEDKLRYMGGPFNNPRGSLVLTVKELYFLSKEKRVFAIPLTDIVSVNCEMGSPGTTGTMTVIYRSDGKEKRVNIRQTSLSYSFSFGNLSRTGPHYFASWEQTINQTRHGPWYRGGEGIEDIKKLARLKDQGIITEEEFVAKKRQILNL
jgi:hypothetical protein